jgi:hypothetical protein
MVYLCKYSLKGMKVWLSRGYAFNVKGSIGENQLTDIRLVEYVIVAGSKSRKGLLRS